MNHGSVHEGVILKDQLSAFCYYRIPSYDCISLGMEDATWEMVKRRYDQGSKKLSPNVVSDLDRFLLEKLVVLFVRVGAELQ